MPDRLAEDWYQQFKGSINQALSSRIGRTADIEDLAQEVYLRLLRVPKLSQVQNPKAYLYRVALNVADEWRQRAAQRYPHSSDPLEGLVSDEDSESSLEIEERRNQVVNTLSKLPPMCRTAVILHVKDGLTYDEIAEHMGISRRSVKRQISMGYAELRMRLDILHVRSSNKKHPGKS